jgi:signal transduction histidine kinase
VGLTAVDARNVRFSGSDYAYDGKEVEDFRRRVVEALEASEHKASEAVDRIARLEAKLDDRASPGGGAELDAAKRAREQAVQLTSRMMAEMLGNKTPSVREAMAIWKEAIALRSEAEEEMLSAREEARRLRATVQEEAAELRAATKVALDKEIRSMLENSARRSMTMTEGAEKEVHRLDRRLTQLRTALRDAEARIRGLTSDALTELRMLGDLLELETSALDEIESLNLPDEAVAVPNETVIVPDEAVIVLKEPETPAAAAAAFVRRVRSAADKDESVGRGFYERRLAGLRERIERNNPQHFPED